MLSPDPAARRAAARTLPPLEFKHDADLPITACREDILRILDAQQVIIVAGDTGSGKSTQLPQYCLESARGMPGLIAHTQPRRLAARALAARIADELGQAVGQSVGFRVRFADQVSEATRLLLMTDGLLLAELGADPLLQRYDTIIVDEAHERSLNVDLLLGVLKSLLPRRPDLKVIVTSATLDVERISRFFGDAPIVTVSGRNFPIEVRYLREADDEPDLPQAVLEACAEIAAEPGEIGRGDVLVFLPGEQEIRDVSELLERELRSVADVLPLYSRLSWEQQSKIFQRSPRRRIVLSTNVAETSITVPGIRAVVDSGLARISRYSVRNRLQRLPIEPIARAGAEQRKGRCGRLGAGLCLRLYTQADFERRAAFTEPEVLRTNLAALLLRLAAEGLGPAEEFPFIDPPDARALNDGYRLLQELQALDEQRRITRRGRAMARLPLDPRLGRALLESQRFHAEAEVLAIVAALSVPELRSGDAPPLDAALLDGKSEFSALLKLWRAYRRARARPWRELRRWCKEQHLSLLRLSEWDDVHAQAADRARALGIVPQGRAASYAAVHRALLAGFCTTVGSRGEEGVYAGTRGVRFHIFPGSPLARRRPRWVMAASIVETSRVFARRVAEVEPKWIEAAAAHLLKREYLEPDFSEEREEVVALERVSLHGLILSAGRVVNYGPLAPEASRQIFAREALVYQRLQNRPDWLRANDAALRAARQIEDRLRSRDLLQGAEALVEFYGDALPRQVSSAASLEHFSRHMSAQQRAGLQLTPERIFARLPDAAALEQFPPTARLGSLALPVDYCFAPGEPRDGASVRVPLLALPGMTRALRDAAIPGFAAARIEALLRSLPKDTRRQLIPIAATAARFLAEHGAAAADVPRLKAWLMQQGMPETSLKFDHSGVPRHLNVRLSIMHDGREIAHGTDPSELRRHCALSARAELQRQASAAYGTLGAWRRFEADALADSVLLELERSQGAIALYPTLALRGTALQAGYEWSAPEAQRAFEQGAVRLARIMLEPQARDLARTVASEVPLLLGASPYMSGDELTDLILQLVFRRACFQDDAAPRTRAGFERAVEAGRERLYAQWEAVNATAALWFQQAAAVRRALDDARVRGMPAAVEESRRHVRQLLDPRLLSSAAQQWLRQLPRYLKAEERRWQRNAVRGSEPANIAAELQEWAQRQQRLALRLDAELRWIPDIDELRFWIEEYRVSSYAQDLKTLAPISAARLEQRAAAIEAWLSR